MPEETKDGIEEMFECEECCEEKPISDRSDDADGDVCVECYLLSEGDGDGDDDDDDEEEDDEDEDDEEDD